MSVRVRFAPSPTGFVHIGSLRTALYNFLYARKMQGNYVLRVEDTDRTRLVEGAVEGMLSAMNWAGVNHDEGVMLSDDNKVVQNGDCGPYIQSERLDIYKEHIKTLIDKGDAYYCFCSRSRLDRIREQQKNEGLDPKYDGHCRELSQEEIQDKLDKGEDYVIRMKLPENKSITFNDIVRGKVSIHTSDMDDQVLIKADGFPTYHFAVVVDDHMMDITHVIRGEEWLTSTPKHVLLYQMFGWKAPTFVHLPNILNADRKKLSKRQGDVAVEDFRNKGYLPEALVNYIALVGWSPEDNKEIFSMPELIEAFSLERVSKSGGVFDTAKLNWVNSHYIKEADTQRLVDLASKFVIKEKLMGEQEVKANNEWLLLAMDTVKDRLDYLAQFPEEIKSFLNSAMPELEDEAKEFMKLEHMMELADELEAKITAADKITPDFVSAMFKEIQKEKGIKGKNLFMGTRVIITGQNHGPDIPMVLSLLGKEKALSRIEQAKAHIRGL
ncbi:glutamyl-tRNA synthetase [Acetoanaerobium sticklandii]|uniref:Glutamate--tRNA ligase n=1 Tax=Acetoanaerobium sticklandii (strain ATCC 12662 / DSM 519 / JCM 1433 / CCUG 9281 / NCIMB 10654 / HF) TaxID=499177 RepID=E3PUC5_ACESD|nr:glutamate--tRNA ligase [Acetoanaerobium sticklandii]CBH22363.1 glutamyl-tRNA synthetase [Acetoanaerobium sticklandii]